jgi:hypothetical protein
MSSTASSTYNLGSRSITLGHDRSGDASSSSTPTSTSCSAFAHPTKIMSSTSQVRHNSIVIAMLSSNTLRDCHQVTAMFSQCQKIDDNESRICDTARNYIRQCHVAVDFK